MSKTNFNPRVTAYLEERGIIYDKSEYWKAFGKSDEPQTFRQKYKKKGVHKDLFGFMDFVALPPGQILAIQSTSRKDMSARRKKILNDCTKEARAWLERGGAIEIWGWYKMPRLKKNGQKSKISNWNVERQAITLADFEPLIPF